MEGMRFLADKKYSSQIKYQKEHITNVLIHMQDNSGLPQALDIATQKTGMTKHAYCLEAVREKLIRENFLTEDMVRSPVHMRAYDETWARVEFDNPLYKK